MTFDGVTVKYAGGRFLMNHRVYNSTIHSQTCLIITTQYIDRPVLLYITTKYIEIPVP